MKIDYLVSWFTIGPVQYASYTLMESPWETHPDGQDKSSLQVEGGALQPLLDCPNHELTMDNLSTYKEPMTCIFYAILNASKSCTM